MTLYGGIDLHANNSVVVLLDEQDQVVYQKRLSNCLEQMLQQLAPYQASLRGLVVESTYNWYWLVDGLMEAGYTVHLANTAAIQQYAGLKYTDDHSDARWLAHLLRLGLLPQGYIYPKAERAGPGLAPQTGAIGPVQDGTSAEYPESDGAQYRGRHQWQPDQAMGARRCRGALARCGASPRGHEYPGGDALPRRRRLPLLERAVKAAGQTAAGLSPTPDGQRHW